MLMVVRTHVNGYKIFLGSVFTTLGLIADPAGFYHEQVARNHGAGLMVALGTVWLDVETDGAVADILDMQEGQVITDVSADRRVEAALVGTFERALVGVASATAGASSHDFKRFDTQAFVQGLEVQAGRLALHGVKTYYKYRYNQVRVIRDKDLLNWALKKFTPEGSGWGVGRPDWGSFGRVFETSLSHKKRDHTDQQETPGQLAMMGLYDHSIADPSFSLERIMDFADGTAAPSGGSVFRDRRNERESKGSTWRDQKAERSPLHRYAGLTGHQMPSPRQAHFPPLNSLIHSEAIIRATVEAY
jgi:hypothetical protein